ncbi:hypothetical protein [Spirosoma sp. KNUC1025]|uniref:hypothetical protein n=1 Tax=Spirosoma sp. KNUC1025 TaxID=2894082 RepID=UPI00386CBBFD|nr:hypothetical protein LN737_08380 [Spirosoma sp. KNUC1025]
MQLIYKFLLLFFCSFSALAQVKLPVNELGQVQYQEIVRLPDAKRPAKQIMEQAREWGEEHYGSIQTAQQQYDPEHNILFIKASYPINNQLVRYTLTIEPKYGRYRATLTDLIAENNGLNVPIQATSPTAEELHRAAGGNATSKDVIEQTVQQQTELYQQLDKACRATLASLKQALTED